MTLLSRILVVALAGVVVASAADHTSFQHAFNQASSVHSPGAIPMFNATGWAGVVNSLELLGSDAFTRLQHPAFPEHAVRIKRVVDWCDTTVK